jgi:hypothetical protein
MHEIGILYLNYELLLRGKRTIYLGRSIPVSDLELLQTQFENIIWVSQFTVSPQMEMNQIYLEEIENKLVTKNIFWAIGQRFKEQEHPSNNKNLKFFHSIRDVLKEI